MSCFGYALPNVRGQATPSLKQYLHTHTHTLAQFNLAYKDAKGVLITDRCKIADHYVKRWFVFDLISCLPITGATHGCGCFCCCCCEGP